MIKKCYLFLFCLFCIPLGNAQSDLFTQKFGPDQLNADFELLVSDLKACHPALYEYTRPEIVDSLAASLKREFTDSLTEQEFYVYVRKFLSVAGCGHTSAAPSKRSFSALKGKASVVPFHVFLQDNQLYIRKAFDKSLDSLIGAKILSINGVPTEELLSEISSTISRDGEGETMTIRYIERLFQTYYLLIHEMSETYSLALESMQGNAIRLEVDASRPVKYSIHDEHDLIDVIDGEQATFGFIDSSRKVALLDLNSFPSSQFKKFYRKSFKALAEQEAETLILDLRGNGGGYFPNGNRLLQYLMREPFTMDFDRPRNQEKRSKHVKTDFPGKMSRMIFFLIPDRNKQDPDRNYQVRFKPLKRNHFDGTVYILTDGYTFSTSSFVASKLKNGRDAITIGEETGGGEVAFNAVLKWKLLLPNTKVRVTFPMYHVDIQSEMEDQGRGVLPEIPVQYETIQQRMNDIDLEMLKVLQLVQQN